MDGSWVKYGVVPEDRSLTVAALTYHRRARLHGRERREIGEWRGLIPVGAGEEVVCAVVGVAMLHGVFQVAFEGDGIVAMEAVAAITAAGAFRVDNQRRAILGVAERLGSVAPAEIQIGRASCRERV